MSKLSFPHSWQSELDHRDVLCLNPAAGIHEAFALGSAACVGGPDSFASVQQCFGNVKVCMTVTSTYDASKS